MGSLILACSTTRQWEMTWTLFAKSVAVGIDLGMDSLSLLLMERLQRGLLHSEAALLSVHGTA